MLIYLAFWVPWDYNTITRQTKAGRRGWPSPTPLCGSYTSHTIAFRYANPYYNGSLENWQVGNPQGIVSVCMRCGIFMIFRAAFVCLGGPESKPEGDGRTPPPRAGPPGFRG